MFGFGSKRLPCANNQCDARFSTVKSLYWHMRRYHHCDHDTAFESVGYILDSRDDVEPGERSYVHAHRERMADFWQSNKRALSE